SDRVDRTTAAKRKEIEDLNKRIDELRQQIANIQKSIGAEEEKTADIRNGIESERKQALAKAAPEILSARALQRLREIQRQWRGLRDLLQDAKVQAMLKLDDEQLKKIEGILQNESRAQAAFFDPRLYQHDVFATFDRPLVAVRDSITAVAISGL